MSKRVVVTGLGIVSPLGCDPEVVYERAIAGYNGVSPVDSSNEDLKVRFAAQVIEYDPLKYIEKKNLRRMDSFAQYAFSAALQAYEDSGLNEENTKPEDMGVLIGTGLGGMKTFARDLYTCFEKGLNKIPPMFVPMIIPNMASGHVAIALNAQNHCSCTTTACSAGNNAIGDAFERIKHGKAKVMIAGGTESGVNDITLASFNALTALSTNEDYSKASRPFDANRDGFVLGEGAGVLVLEELEHALARNAHIYCEVLGYGSACDAYHITAPSGKGAVLAIQEALDEAKIKAEDIDYINAHGTSTPANDIFETAAIKEAFGDAAYDVDISSTKSMHGHALGGAGGIEAVISIKTLENNIIPPTINFETAGEGCDLNYTPNVAKEKEINYVMSNSLGFGGHNAILIFGKYGK